MTRARRHRLVGLGAAMAAGALGLTVSPAAAQGQEYHWRWSDGSAAVVRTFTQAEYGLRGNLPVILVTAEPAHPTRVVRLEFRSNGHWVLETSSPTDAHGIARIRVNPYCEADSWCTSTISYRLTVGGQSAPLTVTFAED